MLDVQRSALFLSEITICTACDPAPIPAAAGNMHILSPSNKTNVHAYYFGDTRISLHFNIENSVTDT